MEIDRTFRDNNGVEWRVSQMAPSAPSDPVDGWLGFESDYAERRLSPYPHNWPTVTSQRLEQMCRIATPVERTEATRADRRAKISPDVAPTFAPADTTAEMLHHAVILEPASPMGHVSRLVDKWPAQQARLSFRG